MLLVLLLPASATTPAGDIDRAFARMYNYDFVGARRIVEGHLAQQPADPLAYAVRGAAYLFEELARLQILEGEFFSDDKRIAAKKQLKPDPAVRTNFFAAVDESKRRAEAALAANPKDQNALFALCLAAGITTDYLSLIEKRQFSSLSYVKQSHRYAVRLLEANPNYIDAYLTTGFSEYLVASMPFYLRWAVRFDGVQGDKALAMRNMERVARDGRYLRPFAKILLAVAHLREKRYDQSLRQLTELSREFPENKLIRDEIVKVTAARDRTRK